MAVVIGLSQFVNHPQFAVGGKRCARENITRMCCEMSADMDKLTQRQHSRAFESNRPGYDSKLPTHLANVPKPATLCQSCFLGSS